MTSTDTPKPPRQNKTYPKLESHLTRDDVRAVVQPVLDQVFQMRQMMAADGAPGRDPQPDENLPAELKALQFEIATVDDQIAALQAKRARLTAQAGAEIALLRDHATRLVNMNIKLVAAIRAVEEASRTGNFNLQPLFGIAKDADEQATELNRQREDHYRERMEAEALVRTLTEQRVREAFYEQPPAERPSIDETLVAGLEDALSEPSDIPAFLTGDTPPDRSDNVRTFPDRAGKAAVAMVALALAFLPIFF